VVGSMVLAEAMPLWSL